jgi:hypothetical protein
MSSRALIVAGVTAFLAIIAVVLAIHGVAEPGLRAVIRATARTSALCVALAIARIRAREFQILLPVSHGLHFAAIGALALATSTANAHLNAVSAGGLAIYALMVFNAVRPKPALLYILWIIFLVALGVNRGPSLVYPVAVVLLIAAMLARFMPLQRRRLAE